jgi:hypothetical protein
MADEKPAPITHKTVQLAIQGIEQCEIQYASGVLASFTGAGFVLTFTQMRPPIFEKTDELPDTIPGVVLARIFVEKDQFLVFADSLTDLVGRLRTEGYV